MFGAMVQRLPSRNSGNMAARIMTRDQSKKLKVVAHNYFDTAASSAFQDFEINAHTF